MPATLDEVRDIILQEFANANVEQIREDLARHIISGRFFWDGFRGMDIRERNQLVTRKVKNRLGLRGRNVDVLLPLAPGEK